MTREYGGTGGRSLTGQNAGTQIETCPLSFVILQLDVSKNNWVNTNTFSLQNQNLFLKFAACFNISLHVAKTVKYM